MDAPDPALDHAHVMAVVTALSALLASQGPARASTTTGRNAIARTRAARQVVTALCDAGIPADVAAAMLALTLRKSPVPGVSRIHLAAPAQDPATLGDPFADPAIDDPYADDGSDGTVIPIGGRTRTTLRRTQILNLTRRAQYLLAAGMRVADAVAQAAAEGTGRLSALTAAIGAETANWAAHVDAAAHRDTAARAVDSAADQYGDLLGWEAVLDNRTTPECRAADGKNFRVSDPPAIGAPGTVHASCRCQAVQAWADAGMVGDTGDDAIAASALSGPAVDLATQTGSVPVASAGDGPRVTRSAMTGTSRTGSGNTSTRLDAKSRRSYASSGVSRPDGSFPIRNRRDLANAMHAVGRAKPADRPAVRAHIRRRAKALGVKAPNLTG